MRWLHIVLSAVLIIFAALQYNDPDPYFWAPIYGLAALWAVPVHNSETPLCAYAAMGRAVVCSARTWAGVL